MQESTQRGAGRELSRTITTLVGKYHRPDSEAGRTYRLVVAVHPSVEREQEKEA